LKEIFHIVPITATAEEIYQALVEERILQKWWLPNASTNGKIGSIATFPLSSGKGEIKMKILDLNPPNRVYWECLAHLNKDWIGTKVEFQIIEVEDVCQLHFRHNNWKSIDGVFGLVSYYWAALYLTRLKTLLEA